MTIPDPAGGNNTKQVVLIEKKQVFAMQTMAREAKKNGIMMLYMANSQRSHFSAEEGSLNMEFKKINTKDEL